MTEQMHPNSPPSTSSAVTMELPPDIPPVMILGHHDQNLRVLEQAFPGLQMQARGNQLFFRGAAAAVEDAQKTMAELVSLSDHGRITADLVSHTASLTAAGGAKPAKMLLSPILQSRGQVIRPKTWGQQQYVDAMDESTVVFGIGPAGTGKTYLAMAKAVAALQRKEVRRIILTRPAVEAGERLGFLPGSLTEKIDPYLRPLFDALQVMLEPESIPGLLESGTIEVAPLAYMRGRTLSDAFIILDEAQNTSAAQMRMFLTRLGFGSTMVVTGDITQVDLPRGMASGLSVIRRVLQDVPGVHFANLSAEDVVRHELVTRIVQAFAKYDEGQEATNER